MYRESRRERLEQRREEMQADDRRNRRLFLGVATAFAVAVLIILVAKWIGSGPLDLNKAPMEKLETLPGIGPETARAIIKGRPYESIEDLDRVKGIGPATIEKLREKVIVPE